MDQESEGTSVVIFVVGGVVLLLLLLGGGAAFFLMARSDAVMEVPVMEAPVELEVPHKAMVPVMEGPDRELPVEKAPKNEEPGLEPKEKNPQQPPPPK